MKEIFRYITRFYNDLSKPVLAATVLLTGILIYINYHFDQNQYINDRNTVLESFLWRYLTFLIAFALPYLFYYLIDNKSYLKSPLVLFLILISPAIFAWKMEMSTHIQITNSMDWNSYWNQIIYWPIRLIVMSAMLFAIWLISFRKESFFGLTLKNFKWKPYLIMLVVMIPLIALASTQPDFLSMYPKLDEANNVLSSVKPDWLYKLLYELSYGSDFISVELFFRGFLVLAFVKVAGKDTILPMACFYCTIHFGKPLGECISSFFGGILLGIVVFNTRSIFGGLMVHLGIAWLMELGGTLGNVIK